MQRWLARFSFSLLIIGGFLWYELYKLQTSSEPVPGWQALLIVIGGAACIALGVQGIRYRHQAMRSDFTDNDHGN